MQIFTILCLGFAIIASAMPTDPKRTAASTDISTSTEDSALVPTGTTIAEAMNTTTDLQVNVTSSFIPLPTDLDASSSSITPESPPSDPAAGTLNINTDAANDTSEALGEVKILRYAYECAQFDRRVECVTYYDSYCDNVGTLWTNNPNTCGNYYCWCRGYEIYGPCPLKKCY
ncbi:hypothetical protein F4778DRAFT_788846 [Xylariomycetidae sp. FL2044]|nr:hypothetical protein F4778DRAFT_788846 [Xylariomycetidae sp. FL2044]